MQGKDSSGVRLQRPCLPTAHHHLHSQPFRTQYWTRGRYLFKMVQDVGKSGFTLSVTTCSQDCRPCLQRAPQSTPTKLSVSVHSLLTGEKVFTTILAFIFVCPDVRIHTWEVPSQDVWVSWLSYKVYVVIFVVLKHSRDSLFYIKLQVERGRAFIRVINFSYFFWYDCRGWLAGGSRVNAIRVCS